jgi:LysR family hydrogen peroxide-inducible transcriptional activator
MLPQPMKEGRHFRRPRVSKGGSHSFGLRLAVVVPGLQTRQVIEPEVVREVSVVTVAGRRFSPTVAAFVRAIKAYPRPQ